ncbi:MAG: L-threonylcarbamoyladenylate synthase [Bacteroides sp.]|nr:L-threonylcarbamoyladenylate synthase [Bacteroides sp.]MCM1412987.1 L-threonylcarbamoyladenylate synthase [Bacteroides sp.]MCM1471693.1 L-threonylcarbamoyladenylate synthase [Bacteroides sp.]
MQKLRIYPTSINDRFIDTAVEALRRGGMIVYPTDTLYAIGCDALNQNAIADVCRIKGINPQKNSLSVVCGDISQASRYARIDDKAFQILRRYTPGPYTFILPASTLLPKAFKGRREVGIRIPDNEIARRLALALDHPLLSTSMPVGDLDSAEAAMPEELTILAERLAVDLMIDGGQGDMIESTVVDLTDSSNPQILREGKGEFDL